ncbi:MAG: hypothetical protein PVG39_00450 [Desulfobacteraceae bacterium]|jgi:hypothetical protein
MKRNRKEKKSTKESRKARLFKGNGLQKRIKTGQQKSKGRRSNIFPEDKSLPIWKPKDGTHIIDIIPYLAGKRDPATEEGSPTYTFEYQVHTNVGPANKQYICPAMFDKKCPICEYRQKLRDKDDDRYKDYFPKTRNLYNVISYDDKKEAKKGVQIWDVSWYYFEKQLMAISRKPSRDGKEEKTVNFVHPEDGKSITFTIEPAKSKNDFPSFVGHSFDDREYEIDDDILDAAFVLDEIVVIATYDEIKDASCLEDGDVGEPKGGTEDGVANAVEEIQELIDELEDIDKMDELEEFVDDNDLDDADFDEKGRFKKEKKKVIAYLKERLEEAEENSGGDDNEPDYDRDDIDDMSWVKLKKLIKEEGLDVDIDDYDKDSIDDLRDEICDELGIND